MKHVFPKWFYHKEQPDGLIVKSSDELEKLGSGWVQSPALFDKQEEKPAKEDESTELKEEPKAVLKKKSK